MTNHTTNEAQKAPPTMPDLGEPDAMPAPADATRDTITSAPEATPGGEGVAHIAGGASHYMQSAGEDFAPKEPSSPHQKKKSRGAPPAVGSAEAVACALRAPDAPPTGEPAPASESPANRSFGSVDEMLRADGLPELADRVAVMRTGEPVTLRVWRLCKSPRVVLAKAAPQDPEETPRRLRVLKPGVLRVGHAVPAVPADGGNWRQVRPVTPVQK